MANICDYVSWRGEFDFSVSPFNDIDVLILTQIAMVDLEGIVPERAEDGDITLSEAAKRYFSDDSRDIAPYSVIIPAEVYPLFQKCGDSQRFGSVRLSSYVNRIDTHVEKQFSAITATLPDGGVLVVFRGTDDTLVGWKEDLNLSFMSSVPAQREALRYLEAAGERFDGEISVGGHSKGGNLSVYASVKCSAELRGRLKAVYNFDAPGFSKRFVALPEYAEVMRKTKTFIPQNSIVGRFFNSNGKYTVIKSNARGVMQHDAFSWEIRGAGFIVLSDLTRQSKNVKSVMDSWMARIDMKTRKSFADAVYGLLAATDSTTVTELYRNRRALLSALKTTTPRERTVIVRTLMILFGESGKLAAKRFVASAARRLEACQNLKKKCIKQENKQ